MKSPTSTTPIASQVISPDPGIGVYGISGWVIIGAASVWALVAFNLDVSITGSESINFDLLNNRLMHLLAAGFTSIVGVGLLVADAQSRMIALFRPSTSRLA